MNVEDLSPLARLHKLAKFRLLECPKVTDLTALRAAAKRGARIEVPPRLREKLKELKDRTDF